LPALLNQAHRNLDLLGRATGELSNDGAAAGNVTLIRVLSVPRMPGVDEQLPPSGRALLPPVQERVIDAPTGPPPEDVESDERGSD